MEIAGTLPDGREVGRVRLAAGDLVVDLLTLGASVERLIVDGRDVALSRPDGDDFSGFPVCLGLTMGRFANRIGGGRFSLDGIEHTLAANEGANTLHGGPDAFHQRLWTLTAADATSATFTLTSPDGDQGFPGTVDVSAHYQVTPDQLQLTYLATADAPTPINLTNHLYLNPAGEDAGSSDGCMLQVDADRRVEVDAALIPTGRLVDVGDLDLREPRPLPELVLDDCFVVDGSGLRHHATLTSVDLAIEVHSDQPGLQVFTADPIVGVPGRSHTYRGRSAVALETQNFPDAPNQPTFPDSILRPGQTYRATTIWRFRKR